MMLASCRGKVENPVIMLTAWVINLRTVYPESPIRRASWRTVTEANRVVPQVRSTSRLTEGLR